MSADDPSAKDAVVLGADLVAALGFEPVAVETPRPEPFRTETLATETLVTEAVAPTVLDPDAASAAADNGAHAREEVAMSTETETDTTVDPPAPDLVITDDVVVIDDPVADVDRAVDDAATRRGRFGVRGRFSRQAESIIGDTDDASADQETDPTSAFDAPAEGSTAALFADDALLEEEIRVDAPATAEHVTEPAPEITVIDEPVLPELVVDMPPPPTGPPISPWADEPALAGVEPTASLDLTDGAGRMGATIDLEAPTPAGSRDSVIIGEAAPSGPAVADSGLVSVGSSVALAPELVSSSRLTGTKLRARKSRRVIRHIDPWSVLTFSILFHLAFFASLLLAGVLVWNAAIAAGTIENIENFIRELGDYETFEINSDQVFRAAVVIAGMLTLASSVLVVLLTVVFNLISDLIGGIRVTVIEEETVRVPSRRK
jgi:hypothetical protein